MKMSAGLRKLMLLYLIKGRVVIVVLFYVLDQKVFQTAARGNALLAVDVSSCLFAIGLWSKRPPSC